MVTLLYISERVPVKEFLKLSIFDENVDKSIGSLMF